MRILVTGGTGTLGRPTVELLRAAGHELRVLSRKPGEGRVLGDLSTGAGLAEAVAGVDTVLHMPMGWTKEGAQTERVVAAAREAGIGHLLYVSIVGIDANPWYPYYKAKLAGETAIEGGGVPWTIIRVAQFHDFVVRLVGGQARLPLVVTPEWAMQPISIDEVAPRLVELVEAGPSGRVPDIAGPEQRTLRDLAEEWFEIQGRPKKVVCVRLPGRMFRALRNGSGLGSLPGYGRETFAEFAARRAAERTKTVE